MFKKSLALVVLMSALSCHAALDINQATEAELDSIRGIGPGTSGKILLERKKGNFKDWNDFISRVQGIAEIKAANFSGEGVTVNGAVFKAAPAAKK
ncbi:ComEA family DNA-binding protein [Rhodoferax sp.]|uniref:ComEA family DNA-binding protein n=1 Tax=Rhodoferax sp. TaxID=50421 RepID=UPI00272F3894|nr:helix-hairpin-helix domain-containing protein [Rhodoferax sp.]MDP1531121.1 helix-hairpin-helix domain-containing protein [Rhodoferax sp.]MDP1942171.1 helix-hairpin-helix domain-containing protein [Rhodoferax sp.]MDP2442791.1 helix-hairpin-helix domain-containing protein [Rhodoferax sp.]MDZ4207857.1 helix-hairpin-helix domain-containing protein [Rhodoferax sp.]